MIDSLKIKNIDKSQIDIILAKINSNSTKSFTFQNYIEIIIRIAFHTKN